MKNKLLLLVILILLPIAICIKKDENNKEMEDLDIDNKIVVNLTKNNENLILDLNDYLIGVVGQEMPASFNIEALKAQAVAARTFAYNYLIDNNINIKDSAQHYINTDEMKTKWDKDFDLYYDKVKKSVLDTNNEVIKYNNNIIKSYYYAISNGKSENSLAVFNEELPYLTIVDSSFDEKVNNFEVSTSFTYENFCLLLYINPCSIDINNIIRDDSNRVNTITINNKEYSGIEIRKQLSLTKLLIR